MSNLLAVMRFRVVEEQGQAFRDEARVALATLSERAGFVRGHLGRCTDDPALWVLSTEWEGVGAYRRALSSYDVKLHAAPVMHLAVAEPGGFEVLDSVMGVNDDPQP